MEGYRNYQASPNRPAQQSRALPSNPPQASQNDGPPRFQSRGHYLAARRLKNMDQARRSGANVGFAAIHPRAFSRHWLSSPWKAYQGPLGKRGRAILSPKRAKLLDSMLPYLMQSLSL